MVTIGGKSYNTFKGQRGATKKEQSNPSAKQQKAIDNYNRTGKASKSGVQAPDKNRAAIEKFNSGTQKPVTVVQQPNQPFLQPGQTNTTTVLEPVKEPTTPPQQRLNPQEIYTLLNPATTAVGYAQTKRNTVQEVASSKQGTIYRNEFGELFYPTASTEQGTILQSLPPPTIKLSQQVLPQRKGEGFLTPNIALSTGTRKSLIVAGENLVEGAKEPGILGVTRSPLGEKLRLIAGANLQELGYNPKDYAFKNVVLPATTGAGIGAGTTGALKGAETFLLRRTTNPGFVISGTRGFTAALGTVGTVSLVATAATRRPEEQRPDLVFGAVGTIAGSKTFDPFAKSPRTTEFYSGVPGPKGKRSVLNPAPYTPGARSTQSSTQNKPMGKVELQKQSFGAQYNPNVFRTEGFVQERLPGRYRSVLQTETGAQVTKAQLKRTGAGTAVAARQTDITASGAISAERRFLGVLRPGEAFTQSPNKQFSRPPSQVKTNFGQPDIVLESITTLKGPRTVLSKGKTGSVPNPFTPKPVLTTSQPGQTLVPQYELAPNTPSAASGAYRPLEFHRAGFRYRPSGQRVFTMQPQTTPSKDIALSRSLQTLSTPQSNPLYTQQLRITQPATVLVQESFVRPLKASQSPSIVEKYKTDRLTTTSPGAIYKPSTAQETASRPILVPVSMESPAQITKPATSPVIIQKPSQAQEQTPVIGQATSPVQRRGGGGGGSRGGGRSPSPPTIPTPPTITPPPASPFRPPSMNRPGVPRTQTPDVPIPVRLGFELPKRRSTTTPGYNVFVRTRGQFKQINAGPLAQGEALNLGIIKVRQTAAASFKIAPAKRPATGTRFQPQSLRGFYRSTKEPGVLIQAPSGRISTVGEKREIPFKSKQKRFAIGAIKIFGR